MHANKCMKYSSAFMHSWTITDQISSIRAFTIAGGATTFVTLMIDATCSSAQSIRAALRSQIEEFLRFFRML